MQKSLPMKPKEMVQPTETRCVCKWRRLYAVNQQYVAVTHCLKEMQDGEKWSVEVIGLYQHMNTPRFITCLIILGDLEDLVHVIHK